MSAPTISPLPASLATAFDQIGLSWSVRGEDLTTYARDLWPRGLLAIAAGVPPAHPPQAVVWPESTEQVQALVRACIAVQVPLYPFGAGSGVCGGAVPCGGVVVDTKRMRSVAIDRERHTVTFQPGILGDHLERALAANGYTLGHFPSSIMCSTAGGWLATRGAGQCSTKYGKIEDMVLSIELVTGTGERLVLRGGEEGPDLLQLIVGSEGTLGIITEATCLLRDSPEERRMRGWAFSGVAEACAGIRALLQRGLRPAVVRLYDEVDALISGQRDGAPTAALPPPLDLGERPERMDRTDRGDRPGEVPSLAEWLQLVRPDVERAGKGLTRWLVSRALGRPAVLNRLVERMAPRLGRECVLILGFEGPSALTFAEERAAAEELVRCGGRDLGEGPGEHWLRHRYDVSFKLPKVFAAGAFADTMEVATTWDRLLDLYHAVREAVSPHAFVMAHFSHAYSEGCSIYFTFAGRRQSSARDPELLRQDEARYDQMWSAALSAVVRAGGSISHHHGIGRLKAPFMADEHGAGMAVYRRLKAVLDPHNILNPGKMGLDEEAR